MGEKTGGPGPPIDKNINVDEMAVEDDHRYDLNNKYSSLDVGPFFVYLEHKNRNLGRLFPIKIGYFLQEIDVFKKDILDIKSIGLNRVKVVFKNYSIANLLINHEIVKKNELIAFIPKFFTQKKGVVKMVDTFFTEQYLKSAIVSDIPVVEVKRMKRKITDKTTNVSEYIDRQIIVVTFLGNKLPGSIKINMVNFPVDPYVYPVVQCYKCLRYGHTSKQCKGKARCQKCSTEHPDISECKNDFKCIYCECNEHSSLSRDCPVYKKQFDIKKVMAFENKSFKEAEALINNPSYSKIVSNNRFNLLRNDENFPELNSNNNQSNINLISKPKFRLDNNLSRSSQSKKRKASSPPQSPPSNSNHPFQKRNTPSSSIIPNPHREDFIQHKDNLINQISVLVNEIVTNPKTLSINQIREYIAQIFIDNINTESANIVPITISDEDETY